MTIGQLLERLRTCPLVASVQASPGSPLDDTATLLKLAEASRAKGVTVFRIEGAKNVARLRSETGATVIGLIKREYSSSDIYITPTAREVDELVASGSDIIALDATERTRPVDTLGSLVSQCRSAGKLALGDCDTLSSVRHAVRSGCDLISTTLAGYTPQTVQGYAPDLQFLRQAVLESNVPVLAEGRFSTPAECQTAMRIGAVGVVVGGVLNDPVKQTDRLATAVRHPSDNSGAIDVGGTNIRFGLFSPDWQILARESAPRQASNSERLAWIRHLCDTHVVARVGIASGGTIDPASGLVTESKPTIPDNEGFFGIKGMHALNDGLATAWGHACHPRYAGLRCLTIAVGTGVGAGFVAKGRLDVGPAGAYPRLNDMPLDSNLTAEQALGGVFRCGETPAVLGERLHKLVVVARGLFQPDVVVLAGSVALNAEVSAPVRSVGLAEASPFGADAGLFGAAALAMFPPEGVFS